MADETEKHEGAKEIHPAEVAQLRKARAKLRESELALAWATEWYASLSSVVLGRCGIERPEEWELDLDKGLLVKAKKKPPATGSGPIRIPKQPPTPPKAAEGAKKG